MDSKTEAVAEKILAGQEDWVKKQVLAKLALEKEDWQTARTLAEAGLQQLRVLEIELGEEDFFKLETHCRVKAQLLNSLTICNFRQNKIAQAIESGEQALSLGRHLFDSSNPNLVSYAENLGDVYRSESRKRKAIECYTQAAVGLEKAEDKSTHRATMNYKLANLYYDIDEPRKALPLLKDADPLFESAWNEAKDQESFQNYANCGFLMGLCFLSKNVQEYEKACDLIHQTKSLCLLQPQWSIQPDAVFDKILQKAIRLMINKKNESIPEVN